MGRRISVIKGLVSRAAESLETLPNEVFMLQKEVDPKSVKGCVSGSGLTRKGLVHPHPKCLKLGVVNRKSVRKKVLE